MPDSNDLAAASPKGKTGSISPFAASAMEKKLDCSKKVMYAMCNMPYTCTYNMKGTVTCLQWN